MIRVTVPASSANLGSGTDCVGVALSLYLNAGFEYSDKMELVYSGIANPMVPLDQDLIYIAAKKIFDMAAEPFPNLRILVSSGIPLCSGLGSSAAAIVAGVCGANALLKNRFSRAELANAATTLEGHPDNVVPSLMGGFTVSMMHGNEVMYSSTKVNDKLTFIVATPKYHLETKAAREVLPKQISLEACIQQLQHACYLVSIMQSGDYEKLAAATEDVIFTPARLDLVKGYSEVAKAAVASGAYCGLISGAGPSVVALAPSESRCGQIAAVMKTAFAGIGLESEIYTMNADNDGVKIEE